MRKLAVIALLMIGGCGQASPPTPVKHDAYYEKHKPPLHAYLDPVDREIARSGRGTRERPFACSYLRTYDGVEVIEGVETDKCFQMEPPKRWKGLWNNEFEGSQFCEAPATTCRYTTEGHVWLSADKSVLPGIEVGRGGLYAIEFIGRRTKYPGMYGHMGGSRHELIVDRILAIKEIEGPPPDWTEDERKAWEEKCRAAVNCLTNDEMNRERSR